MMKNLKKNARQKNILHEGFSSLNTEVFVMSPNRKARLRDSYQLQKFLSDARELVR